MNKKLSTQVKILKLVNGDDIVCTLPLNQDTKSKWLKVERPLQIKYIPKVTHKGITDYVALVKWTAYSPDEVVSIPKDKIMTVTVAAPKMTNTYCNVAIAYERQGDLYSEPPGTTEGSGNYEQNRSLERGNINQDSYDRLEVSESIWSRIVSIALLLSISFTFKALLAPEVSTATVFPELSDILILGCGIMYSLLLHCYQD